jgi:hypothetical protein
MLSLAPHSVIDFLRSIYAHDLLICMSSKINKVRAAWAAGDRIGALRMAARFFDRSADTKSFKRGMDAHNHPDFYRQVGRDPEKILAQALENLATRFNLQN